MGADVTSPTADATITGDTIRFTGWALHRNGLKKITVSTKSAEVEGFEKELTRTADVGIDKDLYAGYAEKTVGKISVPPDLTKRFL